MENGYHQPPSSSEGEDEEEDEGDDMEIVRVVASGGPPLVPNNDPICGASLNQDTRRPVSWTLFLLTTCWGMSSWIGVNGLWVELPVLVNQLPEGWTTPSYWTVIISLGNVLPLAFIIHNHLSGARHEHHHRQRWEVPLIFMVLMGQLTACILLTLVWSKTLWGHSLPLMVLLFIISVADCSSSIFFLPFLSHFPPEAISAYYTGGGLSGLLPGLIALAQGVGGDPTCTSVVQPDGSSTLVPTYPPPRFNPPFFFITLAIMTFISLVSFMVLYSFIRQPSHYDHHGYHLQSTATGSRSRYHSSHLPKAPPPQDRFSVVLESDSSDTDNSNANDDQGRPAALLNRRSNASSSTTATNGRGHSGSQPPPPSDVPIISPARLTYLLFLAFIINMLGNGVLPSIQSYSCLPYGRSTYHLAVSLSSAINCVASILVVYGGDQPGKGYLKLLTGVDLAMGAYILALAILSPHPPLVGTQGGSILAVLSWIIHSGLFTYIKVAVAANLGVGGYKPLLGLGIITQLASTSGSLALFPLVNVYDCFEAATFTCPST